MFYDLLIKCIELHCQSQFRDKFRNIRDREKLLTTASWSKASVSWTLGTVTNSAPFFLKCWLINSQALKKKKRKMGNFSLNNLRHNNYLSFVYYKENLYLCICSHLCMFLSAGTYCIWSLGSMKYSNTLFMIRTSVFCTKADWERISAWITYAGHIKHLCKYTIQTKQLPLNKETVWLITWILSLKPYFSTAIVCSLTNSELISTPTSWDDALYR